MYKKQAHLNTSWLFLKIIQNASRVSLLYVYKGCARHAFKGERVKEGRAGERVNAYYCKTVSQII